MKIDGEMTIRRFDRKFVYEARNSELQETEGKNSCYLLFN